MSPHNPPPPPTDNSDDEVTTYLNSFLTDPPRPPPPRVKCCDASRSLYCPECHRLLVSPVPARNNDVSSPRIVCDRTIHLPFRLDVILDDSRKSATGLHAVTLLSGQRCRGDDDLSSSSSSSSSIPRSDVRLIDVRRGEEIPQYDCEDGSFLLFPQEGVSVPLAEVASKVERLVVLDCKWTRSSIKDTNTSLSNLPKVHLTAPPKESHSLRWHNEGDCRLSTIESIYYAAKDVSTVTCSEDDDFIDLFYIMGVQRALARADATREGRKEPYSCAAKEERRALRRTEIGGEKWRRDKEKGRILKEMALVKRMSVGIESMS